jgi:hypothetical protein
MRRGLERAAITAVTAGLALGAVWLAHAGLVRSGSACPLREPTASELETQRRGAMLPLAALSVGPAPIADRWVGTTRDRFVRAEEASGRHCVVEQAGSSVRCEQDRDEELARFDDAGGLVAFDRVRYGLSAADGETALAALLTASRGDLGPPARSWGQATAAFLDSPLRQAGFEYRFADVAVDVTATHMGRDGIVVREQHRAMPRPPRGS